MAIRIATNKKKVHIACIVVVGKKDNRCSTIKGNPHTPLPLKICRAREDRNGLSYRTIHSKLLFDLMLVVGKNESECLVF